MTTTSHNDPAKSFSDIVTKWQDKLLQLDRRNKLLYFKPGANSVRITDQNIDGLVESMTGSKGLTFDYAEERSDPITNAFAVSTQPKNKTPELYIRKGDLQSDTPILELQTKLAKLQRSDIAYEQEQGLNVLFLALGFLKWKDHDKQIASSPLMLFPCDLHRESQSLKSNFRLQQDDDDLTGNPTLAVKLRNDFGIELPGEEFFDIDDSKDGIAASYLATIKKLIQNHPDWEITEDIFLSIFSYSKEAMWRDLGILKENGTSNPIVHALAGKLAGAPAPENPDMPDLYIEENQGNLTGGKLDDLLAIQQQSTILTADYSQLIAMQQIQSKRNIIIHGPPGTGKSQTISNIIASSLLAGEKVLFVSEKSAALDVVKRRLDENSIGTFCLDLHGKRGTKNNFYDQIRQSLDSESRNVRRIDLDYQELQDKRTRLNNMVRALHKVREPLGQSVFQIHGNLAAIQDVPDVSFDINQIDQLDQAQLTQLNMLSGMIADYSREFTEHRNSRWLLLKTNTPSLNLASTIRKDMRELTELFSGIKSKCILNFEKLGMPSQITFKTMDKALSVYEYMLIAPGVPREWLSEESSSRLSKLANEQLSKQSYRHTLTDKLKAILGSKFHQLNYNELTDSLSTSENENDELLKLIGPTWQTQLAASQGTFCDKFRNLLETTENILLWSAETAGLLDFEKPLTLSSIETIAQITDTVGSMGSIPIQWIGTENLKESKSIIDKAQRIHQALATKETTLFTSFEPDLTSHIDSHMLIRYRTEHQSLFRRIFGSNYRKDKNLLRAYQRTQQQLSLSEQLAAVEATISLQKQYAEWDLIKEHVNQVLGERYGDRDTDWVNIESDIQKLETLNNTWQGKLSNLAALVADDNVKNLCREKGRDFQNFISLFRQQTCVLGPEIAGALTNRKIDLPHLQHSLQKIIPILDRLQNAAREPLRLATELLKTQNAPQWVRFESSNLTQEKVISFESIKIIIKEGLELTNLNEQHTSTSKSLEEVFGSLYTGLETDWEQILIKLRWAMDLNSYMPSHDYSPSFLNHIENPNPISYYQELCTELMQLKAKCRSAVDSFQEEYDFDKLPFESIEEVTFAELIGEFSLIEEDADSANTWIQYQMAVTDLENQIGPKTVDKIRSETPDSKQVPAIISRRIYTLWLDSIRNQENILQEFNADNQERIISEFKELDQKLINVTRDRIRRTVLKNYPLKSTATSVNDETYGQLGQLRGQLSRKRGQWPIRRVLKKLAKVVLVIKPCFMMSPLMVSRYLGIPDDSQESNFDTVIFDEASQVFPEDAIPAIMRANQVVLAGDENQLPPSSFWRSSVDDQDYEEEDDDDDDNDTPSNQLQGRESILATAMGLRDQGLFGEAYLNVHYRSRNEDLIRFSNRYIYNYSLMTFPSPTIKTWQGVHDHLLPDARYEMTSGQNRKEAEYIVKLVFEHLRTHPHESLGVVAMSIKQATLINDLIIAKRLKETDVEDLFSSESEEPFFVKNLERVQGDERDRIIICVGYGPATSTGKVPNRFGPINGAHGRRRLNVAITRSKLRTDVVHSLRPNDIVAQNPGAQMLKAYLEYVANPKIAIDAQENFNPDAEPESPFEEAVKQALEARGHRVVSQVGVSRYRIDLAICTPDGTGFDLGVECDGYTYHSHPAARDRDWLRKQHLQGLGWHIHNVWSTAWTQDPHKELLRIEEALTLARARSTPLKDTDQQDQAITKSPQDSIPEYEEIDPSEFSHIGLVPYEQVDLPKPSPGQTLANASISDLIWLIIKIAKKEGPVHEEIVLERLRVNYRLSKLKGSTRDRAISALSQAVKKNHVLSQNSFIFYDVSQHNQPIRKPTDSNIDHIARNELASLVEAVVKRSHGIQINELVQAVARQLDFKRTGSKITLALHKFIMNLIEEKKLRSTSEDEIEVINS